MALTPLILVAVVDAWVYQDVTRRAATGRPVEARIGGLVIDTPAAWLTGCVVLLFLFWPMYWLARKY